MPATKTKKAPTPKKTDASKPGVRPRPSVEERTKACATTAVHAKAASANSHAQKGKPPTQRRRNSVVVQVKPPVESAPERLPLSDHAFDWKKFEEFCRALVSKLPNVLSCELYGVPGNDQKGIDLVAIMSDGSKVTYQCRQVKKLSAADVQKIFDETEYPAKRHIILTSAEVDTKARDKVDGRDNWELWDIGDVSNKVRELSPYDARNIVRLYFGPAWSIAFLRLATVEAFQTSDVSLAPLLDESRPFNHTHQLVGREVQVHQLYSFALSHRERIAVFEGAGGLGKTRVLLEFDRKVVAEDLNCQVLRVEEGVPLTDAVLDHFPAGPSVLIVDDAHRRNDIDHLLAILRQQPKTKVVFATRPHAVRRLENSIRQANFGEKDVAPRIVLEKLRHDDLLTLVRTVLLKVDDLGEVGARIARIADGSPLVATIAAVLVRDRAVAPELIQEDKEFADLVFTKFEDAFLGGMTGDSGEVELARGLIGVIAALGPVSVSSESLIESIAQYLKSTPSAIRLSLDSLESSGILVRQEDAIRITPDVLSDHILTRKSVTAHGEPTGYAAELVRCFGAAGMKSLLRNFAELDWRIRRTGKEARSGVDEVWRVFNSRFASADFDVRATLLEILEDVAYYQPDRTFALSEPLIQELSEAAPISRSARERYIRIIIAVAFTLEHLAQCADALIRLGMNEAPWSSETAGIRALKDLVAYDVNKPFRVQEIILDVLESFLKRDDRYLDIVIKVSRSVLSKTGTSTISDRRNLKFRAFSIPPRSVTRLRARVRHLLEDVLRSKSGASVYRTIAVLSEDVAEPMPSFGQQISERDQEDWIPERLASLELLEKAVVADPDPVLRLAIREGIKWQANHGRSGLVKQRAMAVITSIPSDFDFNLSRILRGYVLGDEAEPLDFQASRAKFDNTARELAREYVEATPDPVRGSEDLQRRLEKLAQWHAPNPGFFFDALAASAPDYATDVLRSALANQLGYILGSFSVLFLATRRTDPDGSADIMRTALTGPTNVRMALAITLAGCATDLRENERETWRQLLQDDDPAVRTAALSALSSLAATQPTEALALSLNARFESTEERAAPLVDELCTVLHSIDDVVLDDDALHVALDIIGRTNFLSGYWTKIFLRRAVRRSPAAAVRMLIQRIEKDRPKSDPFKRSPFEALPFDGLREELSDLRDYSDYEKVLKEIVELGEKPGWARYEAAKLFRDVAVLDMTATETLLRAQMSSGMPKDVQYVASLVEALPSAILTKSTSLLSAVLQAARAAGVECFKRVEGALCGALTPHSWQSPVGQPDLEQVDAMNRALTTAQSFPEGSLERALFDRVATSIKATIESSLQADEKWLNS